MLHGAGPMGQGQWGRGHGPGVVGYFRFKAKLSGQKALEKEMSFGLAKTGLCLCVLFETSMYDKTQAREHKGEARQTTWILKWVECSFPEVSVGFPLVLLAVLSGHKAS